MKQARLAASVVAVSFLVRATAIAETDPKTVRA